MFAILGLRSLYFVLAEAVEYFRYLRIGLAVILVFIGVKMLLGHWHPIATTTSLEVILGIFAVSIGVSIATARLKKKAPN
jgi:tellurite resistance protein TerC